MVVLHVKSSTSSCSSFSPSPSPSDEEEMEFLYECAATTAVADVAAALAGTAGLQARLLSLCRRLRGRSPSGELERALSEAEAYASKVQVRHNKFLSPRALREHMKNIEKTAAGVLQETSEALCTQQPKSDEKLDSIQLWWAGKELAMDKKLSDYIGVNDKTKCLSECNRRSLESGNVTHGKPALFSNRPKIWCGKMAPLCRQVQVHHNKFLSSCALREHIKNIEKAAANALQETSEAFFLQHPKSDEKCDSIQLWWGGKELAMDKKLSDYIGVNDKTKIVVRLSLPMSL